MIIFPQSPVWFSLKFITAMRNHEKCMYKPSIRQAIAICKLIIARFMNRGQCEIADFVEIAVVTSPLENQALARKIATELLSYSDPTKNRVSSDTLKSDMFGSETAQDLLDELTLDLSELDEIYDDFELLDNFFNELEDLDLEQLIDESLNDFFDKFADQLEEDPYKTALKFIDNNAVANFNQFKDLDAFLDYARELLKKKINHLEPEDIDAAEKLGMLDEISSKTESLKEKLMSQLAKDQNLDAFKKGLEERLIENSFEGLNIAEFALKSNKLNQQGQNLIKDLLKQNLSKSNKNLNDIFNTSKILGMNPKIAQKKLDNILNTSLKLPFKDAYNNAKNFDQYFGDNLSEQYLNEINENFENFNRRQSSADIKDELINNPIKSPAWRKLISNIIDKDVEAINKDYNDDQMIDAQMKNYIDNLIESKKGCSDLSCQSQLKSKVSELINKTVGGAATKDSLSTMVKDFNKKGFTPDMKTIKDAGTRLGMTETEILNLIEKSYKAFKQLVKENQSTYKTYKDYLDQLGLTPEQIDEVVKLALGGAPQKPPNLDVLSALSEKNLAQVLKSAEEMGKEALDMAFSSLGAGSGLDLLEQWFYSRHNISAKIKQRLKEIIKQIMIDLGINAANSLIGTAKSGPLVENIVIPYTLGDDFELIDLEETISNLLEGGKTVNTITNDDFLVSKTTDGLRCLVLELDVSGSMSGNKLSQMALCTTMLVYAFKPEELALTFFESNTHKLKNLDEEVELEKVVDELLDITARGGTCINHALKWANLQFEKKARSKYKLNVLFTDADVFDFNNSLKELKIMREKDVKFVMVVPKFGFSPVMANKMVKEADGVLLTLNQWRDFPKLISEIISNQ
ncbi:MAG: VWA domain-containing protein [Candidatus Lokiarchaeota archaeon]|nr:VWA domain-containing protein [Candidatus Lokiarchaeota archaeon]